MISKLILIRGFPGSGKSTLAERISNNIEAIILDPDLIVENSEDFKIFSQFNTEVLPIRRLKYRYLLRKAVEALKESKTVIWAQPWRKMDRIELTIRNIFYHLSGNEKTFELPLEEILSNIPARIKVIEIEIPSIKSYQRVKTRYKKGFHIWDGDSFHNYIKTFDKFNLPMDHQTINSTFNLKDIREIIKTL